MICRRLTKASLSAPTAPADPGSLTDLSRSGDGFRGASSEPSFSVWSRGRFTAIAGSFAIVAIEIKLQPIALARIAMPTMDGPDPLPQEEHAVGNGHVADVLLWR
jgi:hypothetical protein